jgi:DNA repair exonuclease SbcCD ATPase subunit
VTKSSGNVSKNITYDILSSGAPTSFNALSGAEKLSVILSVEEAIDTVVAKRSGVQVGWKFLDEQLMFVDSGNKEFVMDFLKERANQKTYFIVDHASEFNAAIENRIKVIKENGVANIIHE